MPLIIDGYNLLRAAEKLCEDPSAMTDVALCRMIDRYLARTSDKGQIVFDGIGPPDKSGFNNLAHLEVVFSGTSTDADSVIEFQIGQSSAPRSLTVITSDREIRSVAASRKSVHTKSESFWQELNKVLSKKNRVTEPPEKRTGISKKQVEQWMDIFGLDDKS